MKFSAKKLEMFIYALLLPNGWENEKLSEVRSYKSKIEECRVGIKTCLTVFLTDKAVKFIYSFSNFIDLL